MHSKEIGRYCVSTGNAVVLRLLSVVFPLQSLFQLLNTSQKDLLKFARLRVPFHFCFQ